MEMTRNKGNKMFIVGWNMPGYLPEMEPMTADTWENAKVLLDDELSFAQDTVVEPDTDEGWSEIEEIQNLIDDLADSDGDVWSGNAGKFVYWIEQAEYDANTDSFNR